MSFFWVKKNKSMCFFWFLPFFFFEQLGFYLSPLFMAHKPIANSARMRVERFRQRPCSCFAAPKYLPQRNHLEQKITLTDETTWDALITGYTNCCKGENRNVTEVLQWSCFPSRARRMGIGQFFVSTQELLLGPCGRRSASSAITSVLHACHSLSTVGKGAQISQS